MLQGCYGPVQVKWCHLCVCYHKHLKSWVKQSQVYWLGHLLQTSRRDWLPHNKFPVHYTDECVWMSASVPRGPDF
jgi:hypothetical protein